MAAAPVQPVPITTADLEVAAWSRLGELWADLPADGAHDTGHLRRVLAHCLHIARSEQEGDPLVLIPAAILHDAVNLPKSHPDRARAAQLSAEAAAEFLNALPLYPEALIPQVCHAIAAHSFSAGIAAQTAEARILQDADRLEALGALGLARMFNVSGQLGVSLFDDADPLALSRPLDDRRYALDHIEVKLLPVARGLQTATGRALARERIEAMLQFRDALIKEISPCG